MIVLFLAVMLAGFAGMVLASRRAVGAAIELAASTQIPPFFVGVTLLAIGTDLPEIANSIASSLADHGDVNVGDSVGSAATQATLILGVLPIIGGTVDVPRHGLMTTGWATVGALGLVAFLLSDGRLDRLDGLVLFAVWAATARLIYTRASVNQQLTITEPSTSRRRLVARTFVALLVVAGSAMLSLWGIVETADALDAPELLVSFFVASIGTSMPELAFNLAAIRRGAVAMAIGDLVGASFIDATLSIGSGPLIAPTDVSRDLAVKSTMVAMVAVAAAVAMLSRIERHDWRSGAILIAVYAGFFVVLL